MLERTAALLLIPALAAAQPLPGTAPLEFSGGPAAAMVDGIGRYLERIRPWFAARRNPDPPELRRLIGAIDRRADPVRLEFVSTPDEPAVLASGDTFEVLAVRWSALDRMDAEGLYLRQLAAPRHLVIYLPETGRQPEDCLEIFDFAAAGADVLVPLLLSSSQPPPPAPGGWARQQTEREWILRMGFPVGRHPLGLEVQKVLAFIDWWKQRFPGRDVEIAGAGDGAWIAFFAAILDPRIALVETGHLGVEPPSYRTQPLYRNIFGFARFFGEEDLRALLRGRLGSVPRGMPTPMKLARRDPEPRRLRNIRQMEDFLQRLARRSRRIRDGLWFNIRGATPEQWRLAAAPLEKRIREEMLGELPPEEVPPRPRTRPLAPAQDYRGWEVMLDVRPEFFAYGVLLVPARMSGARIPLVVVQHGLQGRPQDLYGQKPDSRAWAVYRNWAETLVGQGWAVYLPQNLYTGDFRHLVRMAHPLGLTQYSFIREQYRAALGWLASLPFIDADRIGFYGISYGGKTALRVTPFDPRFRAVVCAGDFNEWVGKMVSIEEPWSYMFTEEYDMLEWNLAHIASHAELAMLIAPRPFLVERGHRDPVGIDEWVLAEYARVKRFYDEMGIGNRAGIALFNGPHRVDGEEVLRFFRKWLTEP
ncbi:MAG: alpha/beta hydrolase family protein [Acidobacteriota bacterium]